MKKMRLFLVTFFLFAFAAGFAQDDYKPTPHEMGIKVIMKDPKADASKYMNAAMGYYFFDQYRFMDKRRELQFEDGKAVLVLYSANEMLNDVQKKLISPVTIQDGASYQGYVLAITLDGNNVKPMPTGAWFKNN